MKPSVVYVIRDSAAVPLYVGMTCNLRKRLTEHRSTAKWWPTAYTIASSDPMGRHRAGVCERVSILTLSPRHNRQWRHAPRDMNTVTECFAAAFLGMTRAHFQAFVTADGLEVVSFNRLVGNQSMFRFSDVVRLAYAIADERDGSWSALANGERAA